ncbi:MAG TPA: MFS transporter [Xanthobacteraceae bacterium]|nr:MFS transporter [Xanthobacteraceae bacterium]
MDARAATNQTLPPATGLYHGWRIVAAAFLVAVFGWGLGFYGLGIYLVALRDLHGWSTADIAAAITGYYILSATLTFFFLGTAFDRYGTRRVVAVGTLAMGLGVAALTFVTRLWHVYAALAVMSIGCATMTGASISIIVAPWFDRRRGLAASLALNGASAGGLVMAPLLIFLIGRLGFAAALWSAAALMLVVLLPLLALIARPKRPDEHHWADRPPAAAQRADRSMPSDEPPWNPAAVLRNPNFLTIAIPFALGLTAQVGFLTHQVAFLAPLIGTVAAGWAVSLTTFAAVAGRLLTGLFVDRVDRRAVSCGNFLVQVLAMGVLMSTTSAPMLFAGCFLFGLALGNLVSLPGLIVQQEFPKRDFARIVSMVVAVNQYTFAFGPALLGRLEQAQGTYTRALLACLLMQLAAAVIVLLPIAARMRRSR